MVGLSVVLEYSHNKGASTNNNKINHHPQVINKASMINPTSPPPLHRERRSTPPSTSLPAAGFLDRCFLCCQRLLPGKDIYMYKGDRGFCSVECRCRQIFMDEERESSTISSSSSCAYKREYNCSSSSSSSSSSRNQKGTRNRANGFAY